MAYHEPSAVTEASPLQPTNISVLKITYKIAYSPIGDHRATGCVEIIIKTIRERLLITGSDTSPLSLLKIASYKSYKHRVLLRTVPWD